MTCLPKALALAFVVLASPPILAAAPAQPLLGDWALDTSRMPMPPDQRPKSVRFAFADAGAGKLSVHVDIVYAPGSEVHSVATVALDGRPAIVENSPEADHVSVKRPTPGVVVMALQKEGILVSTRIYAVTPDGRGLVETAVYPGDKDVPVMRTNYFTRVR
ncbi:hypothetical protein [Luteibacter sp. CQ10]|uniref:hypothetical protein n=1 Tax=Luteibacter sp. CQ10 TaxID=2805821 RepID=UPI0034A1AE94